MSTDEKQFSKTAPASKFKFLLFCLLASSFALIQQLHAEVLIYPAGHGDHFLTITQGQTITINTYRIPDSVGDWPVGISVSNVTFPFPGSGAGGTEIFPDEPITLAGPFQLVFSNSASHVFSYSSFTGAGVQTLFMPVPVSRATNTISVPTNKSIVFLRSSPYYGDNVTHSYSITKGSNTVSFLAANGEAGGNESQFSGPLTIQVVVDTNYSSGVVQIISYYFTEDFAAVPQFGAIQAPTGNFSLAIEKSADLTNWSTVFFSPQSSGQKAFYRFNIKK